MHKNRHNSIYCISLPSSTLFTLTLLFQLQLNQLFNTFKSLVIWNFARKPNLSVCDAALLSDFLDTLSLLKWAANRPTAGSTEVCAGATLISTASHFSFSLYLSIDSLFLFLCDCHSTLLSIFHLFLHFVKIFSNYFVKLA